ncbi:MAG: radical SAM protein [Candidatus Gottesmanbacteria bacterium]
MTKILLINPPAAEGIKMVREGRCMQREGAWAAVWAPISLATIAAVLKKNRHKIKLIDAIVENLDFTDIGIIIRGFDPDLIILNTATGSIISDLSLASLAKKIKPRVLVAAFGIHVSVLPEECLNSQPSLDFIIRGEPELTSLELADTISCRGDISQIKGISYRHKNQLINNPDRQLLKDLDSLPFPDWGEINTKNYRMPFSGKPFLLVATGRGCPFQCLFCADRIYYGKNLRLPSPERVVDEIEDDINKYNVNEFLFWTESFTLNRQYAISVCQEIINRNLRIKFVVNSRVDNINQDLLNVLKKAGCFMIGFGIESGDDRLLLSMKKGITVNQIKRAVIASNEAGLDVTGHFMIGYPGETKRTIMKTIDLACTLPFDFAQFYCAVPFPGSDLYPLALKNKWLITDNWIRFEQNYSVIKTTKLTPNEVMHWRNVAYRKFYFRPKIIIRSIMSIRSIDALAWFTQSVFKFLNWTK